MFLTKENHLMLHTTENQNTANAPDLDKMLKGREDNAVYSYFVNVYLVCSKGRGVQKSLTHTPPSKVFTVCDEVIVMWYMENNWHVWADMKKTGNTKKSDVAPKYTVPGDKGGGGARYSGWNEEGKKRFNELFKTLQKQRQSVLGKSFDDYYISLRDGTNPSKKKKKTTKKKPTKPIKMMNTLESLVQSTNINSSDGMVECTPGSYPMDVTSEESV
jgi:hypothetical protein